MPTGPKNRPVIGCNMGHVGNPNMLGSSDGFSLEEKKNK